jgi:hypothetical protein
MSNLSHARKLVIAIASVTATFCLLSCAAPVAAPVPGLPGYVLSPYTYFSERMVDVTGAAPGTVVICPYTYHPFVVPPFYADGYASSGTVVAQHYSGK